MGDIRAGLDELKLEVALFADVKYYVSGEGDPKVRTCVKSRLPFYFFQNPTLSNVFASDLSRSFRRTRRLNCPGDSCV